MGRLSEHFGRLAGCQPHGKATHLGTGAARGGSRPKTRPGPLQKTYRAADVPELMQAGGYTFGPHLPMRMVRAGKMTQLLMRMQAAYRDGDRQTFDRIVPKFDRLAGKLDDLPGDLSMMGPVYRGRCFPLWTRDL